MERTMAQCSEVIQAQRGANPARRNELHKQVDEVTMGIAELNHNRQAEAPPKSPRKESNLKYLREQRDRLQGIAKLYGRAQALSRDANRDTNANSPKDIMEM